jgi:solute carrier family 25 citrate transporter 1
MFLSAFRTVSRHIAVGIEAFVMWPTENVKTQLQLQGKVQNPKFRNFSGGVRYIVSHHGMRGLYRGLAPILIGSTPKVTRIYE